jgi:hypothetical protein
MGNGITQRTCDAIVWCAGGIRQRLWCRCTVGAGVQEVYKKCTRGVQEV